MNTALKLTMRVDIRPADYSGGGLQVEHSFELQAGDFMEMCRILGQFDELAKKIASDKRPAPGPSR